jgi:hypothetical protein
MSSLDRLNLLRLFDFYLAVMFLTSTMLRARQYQEVLALVRSFPARWPKLLRVVRQHASIFLTGSTLLPLGLALGLLAANMIACRLVWPTATVTPALLQRTYVALPLAVSFGILMLGVDLYCTFTIGTLDRAELQKYFDQAEFWLKPWTAPVVSVFSLGYFDPRRLVSDEVRKALLQVSDMLNVTLWWTIAQVGLRVAFGLTLWLAWAIHGTPP